jgi:hypothetical protein
MGSNCCWLDPAANEPEADLAFALTATSRALLKPPI